MPREFFEPIFGPKQRIQVKREACIDPFGSDVNSPKKVCLPTDIESVEGHHRKFKFVIQFAALESPQSMLSIDDLDGMQTFRFPADAREFVGKFDFDDGGARVCHTNHILRSYFNTASLDSALKNVHHNRRRQPSGLPQIIKFSGFSFGST